MLRRSVPRFNQMNSKPVLITYVSDIEGCHDFFQNYLSRSKVLSCDTSSSPSFFNVKSLPPITFKPEMMEKYDCHFVFGGDAFDKGPGDIRLATQLFAFQDKFPKNVHFILGNRDTNKLKLVTEMTLSNRDQHVLPQPYYLNEKMFFSYEKFLEKEKEKPSRFIPSTTKTATTTTTSEKEEQATTHQRSLLLKYLLAHRFGSAELFEYRRHELAVLAQTDGSANNNNDTHISVEAISDHEVIESFVQMSHPGGLYYEFVKRGKLALRIPNSDCAFVHGAINDDSFGIVPTMDLQELPYTASLPHGDVHAHPEQPPLSLMKIIKPDARGTGIVDVDAWFDELEAFKMTCLDEWEKYPEFDPAKPNHRRGGASLFAYGHGRAIGSGVSVEVSTYVRNGEPQHIGMNTAVALNLNGIFRVAVGHQPIGDTPLVISQPGVTTVMGDVSYGDKVHHKPPNGRGAAVAEVLFYPATDDEDAKTVIHGCTSQGVEYNFQSKSQVYGGGGGSSSFSFEETSAPSNNANNNHKPAVSSFSSEFASYSSTSSSSSTSPSDICFLGKRSHDGWWSIGQHTETGKILARKTKDAFRTFESEWLEAEEAMKKFISNTSAQQQQKASETADVTTAVGSKQVLDGMTTGFGQFFNPEYEARASLQPTASYLGDASQKDISRDEKTASFGKAKVKPTSN